MAAPGLLQSVTEVALAVVILATVLTALRLSSGASSGITVMQ